MKKRKLKKKKTLLALLLLILFIVFIISTINIIKWVIDNNKSDDEISKVQNISKIKEIDDNSKTEIVNKQDLDKFNPYWDYIKMNLIDVDFKELKKENNDVKGWIQVNGTNINYPFVQTNDNEYYLTHSFNKSKNSSGWVFLDYRNNIENLDKNTIIYAHGRMNKTMFGSLRTILSSKWVKNTDNYIVKLSTMDENTLWQVFSIYEIPTTSDYLTIHFTNNEFESFANLLLKRSQFDFNTTVNKNDKILTLSTCYNESNKVVLHAKLIKKQKR